jgi:hypothetical protein
MRVRTSGFDAGARKAEANNGFAVGPQGEVHGGTE